MLKWWIVSAEINMDASHHVCVEVKAHTEKKAREYAETKIRKQFGAFFVNIQRISPKEV